MLRTEKIIKIARIKKGLSQQQLADRLGVSTNYISLVEGGKKDPSIKFLKQLSRNLEIPLILLLYEKIDLPQAENKEERAINVKLENMVNEAQLLFAQQMLGAGEHD